MASHQQRLVAGSAAGVTRVSTKRRNAGSRAVSEQTRNTLSYASFHAVSVKADHDAAVALNAALATATRQLHDQAREAETTLDCFHLWHQPRPHPYDHRGRGVACRRHCDRQLRVHLSTPPPARSSWVRRLSASRLGRVCAASGRAPRGSQGGPVGTWRCRFSVSAAMCWRGVSRSET